MAGNKYSRHDGDDDDDDGGGDDDGEYCGVAFGDGGDADDGGAGDMVVGVNL